MEERRNYRVFLGGGRYRFAPSLLRRYLVRRGIQQDPRGKWQQLPLFELDIDPDYAGLLSDISALADDVDEVNSDLQIAILRILVEQYPEIVVELAMHALSGKIEISHRLRREIAEQLVEISKKYPTELKTLPVGDIEPNLDARKLTP